MMAHWSNDYIGIPHLDLGRYRNGADCWGLVRLVFEEVHGIRLPSYSIGYVSTDEFREISGLIAGARESDTWKRVDGFAKPFDVAVFRRGQYDAHVGVLVSDGVMLHMAEGAQSCIEHYRAGKWGHRLTGVYRYVELASRPVQ